MSITLLEVFTLSKQIKPAISHIGNRLLTDVRYDTANFNKTSKLLSKITAYEEVLDRMLSRYVVNDNWFYVTESDIVIPKSGIDRDVHRIESGLGIVDYKINVRSIDKWSITTSNYAYDLVALGASFPYNLQITIDGVLQDYVGINTQPELDAYFADLLFTKNSNTNYSITNTEIIYGDLVITDRSFDNSFDNSFG